MMKKHLLLLCLVSISYCSLAQSRLSDHNVIGWLALNIDPKISDKWSAHIEYQLRREQFVVGWQQSLLRLGLDYKISPQVSVLAGYAWIVTPPYGTLFASSVRKPFSEHRIYEQLVTTSNLGRVKLMHRLRLEQRFNGKYSSMEDDKQEYKFTNRVRYMPRVDIPLDKNNKAYAAFFDEIFIGFGENVGQNVFDQNRIGIMLGYNVSKAFRLEGGYLNQTVQFGRQIDGRNVFQYNDGVLVTGYLKL